MRARYWLMLGLLYLVPYAHAAEADDASLEVIEMLGELEDEDVALDIAMSEIGGNMNEKIASPQEVKDER